MVWGVLISPILQSGLYSSCCQDNRTQTAAAKAAAAFSLLPPFRETWDLLEQPYPTCSQESQPGNSCPSKPVALPTVCHLSVSRKLLAKCRKLAMLGPVNDAVPVPFTSPCGPQDKSKGPQLLSSCLSFLIFLLPFSFLQFLNLRYDQHMTLC